MKRPAKTLEMMLFDLVESGHRPGLYFRGDVFRAHVDVAGNFWGEDELPSCAMEKAIELFVEKNSPLG